MNQSLLSPSNPNNNPVKKRVDQEMVPLSSISKLDISSLMMFIIHRWKRAVFTPEILKSEEGISKFCWTKSSQYWRSISIQTKLLKSNK